MLVAVLGTLKAGAAYLPLDPGYPVARIRFILSDAAAALTLTTAALQPLLPDDAPRCLVDRTAAAIAAHPDDDLPPQAGPDDAIYVIYTSGSTGEPKGAVVLHRGFGEPAAVVRRHARPDRGGPGAAHQRARLRPDAEEPVRAAARRRHAAAAGDGGLTPRGARGGDRGRRDHLDQLHAEHLLPAAGGAGGASLALLDPLRWVVLGGEPIQATRLRPWLTRAGCRATILNTYGPTECPHLRGLALRRRHGRGAGAAGAADRTNVALVVLDAELDRSRPAHPASSGSAGPASAPATSAGTR